MERLQSSPAQWAAARQRALDAMLKVRSHPFPVVFGMKTWEEMGGIHAKTCKNQILSVI
jgi:hypothetical protein